MNANFVIKHLTQKLLSDRQKRTKYCSNIKNKKELDVCKQ